MPLLNTAVLLSSGGTFTGAHHAINNWKRKEAVIRFALTVILCIFTALQGMEYYAAPLTITDSLYGSTFFFLLVKKGLMY